MRNFLNKLRSFLVFINSGILFCAFLLTLQLFDAQHDTDIGPLGLLSVGIISFFIAGMIVAVENDSKYTPGSRKEINMRGLELCAGFICAAPILYFSGLAGVIAIGSVGLVLRYWK